MLSAFLVSFLFAVETGKFPELALFPFFSPPAAGGQGK
jgi:hypothetical protein